MPRGNIGEVYQHEVIAKFLVTGDPFVVIKEITAAIKNKPIPVNLNGFRMMRRMTMNDRDVGTIDERMGKAPLYIRNFVTPVRSPMHRNNNQVIGAACARDVLGYL